MSDKERDIQLAYEHFANAFSEMGQVAFLIKRYPELKGLDEAFSNWTAAFNKFNEENIFKD